ncbi:MAG: DEAD/DEAH box helicase [Enhygromyxa sp.]
MQERSQPNSTDAPDSRLATLDPLALDLLGVLALENRPLPHNILREQLGRRGVRGRGRAALSSSRLTMLLDQLDRSGLVHLNESAHVRVSDSVEALEVLALLHARRRLVALTEPERHQHIRRHLGHYWLDSRALMTSLRVALIEQDAEAIEQAVGLALRVVHRLVLGRWMVTTLGHSATSAALSLLPSQAREAYLVEVITTARADLVRLPEHLINAAIEFGDKALRMEVGRLLILRGQAKRALTLAGLPAHHTAALELLAAFWAGDHAKAAQLGDQAIAATRRRKPGQLTLDRICHLLAKLASSGQDPRELKAIEALLETKPSQFEDGRPHATLTAIHAALIGERQSLQFRSPIGRRPTQSWTSLWLDALHDVWLGVRPKRAPDSLGWALGLLQGWSDRASSQGYGPVARELDGVIAALADPESSTEASPSLATAFRAAAPWEAALTGLDCIVTEAPTPTSASEPGRRLIWELQIDHGLGQLSPRLLTSPRSRKGRSVSLSSLLAGKEDCLDAHDQRVLDAAEPDQASAYYSAPPMTLGARALVALIGHPRVFDQDRNPLEVVRGQARIRTTKAAKGIRAALEPRELLELDVLCLRQADQVEIYERSEALFRVAQILGPGLVVPKRGVDRLGRALARLCVHAGIEIEGELEPEAEQVVADSRPSLLLTWDGESLRARGCVAPLGLEGPHLRPGVGNPVVTAELSERGQPRLLRCQRELGEERRRFDELERACPTLLSYAVSPLEWWVPKLADALEVILELERIGDQVVLGWPEGRALRPPAERNLKHLKLAVSEQRDWLGVDAQLELDEGEVLSFRQLIESRAGARFIRLDGDRFVALSEQLRRRLDALEQLGEHKREGLRTSLAMLPMLDELSADLDGASFDPKALARLKRIRELASASPRRPRGFGAELRDYQKDGYTWMWRLAEAGLGACLADDMGLGKTVQALALLSQRASKGPALVVCPTSVVVNWTNEASRFAPNLRATILAECEDRAAALSRLGRRDLLVCSYGVLCSEAEALAEVEFATIVFDEAHALKNERTKRARAARELQAGFRLGLTGTPVENRVDELWSLFRVLTPGLLGSKREFDERFAKPIARGDRERTAQLRAVLRHFLLRRSKSQVLDELPARTEITLRVDPRPEERSYYEALRRRAREAVEKGDPRKKRFRILAEITRLRQAAVDPRLLDSAAAPAGAKIDALVEQILALREEGHRALVFTQFLKSMAIVRERLDAAGVEYIELDGSTAAAERARRVEAFQSGEGDVFLLSLRAGGVGMTLTGADYVLHLDPWWNPAVEDQATDRAHRIGQTRPVTVYRLVTVGSIEEKILALHQSKRELADDILAGLEGAEALDLDELMSLL